MGNGTDISLLFPRRKGSPLFKSTLEKFEKRIDSKDPRKDPLHQQAGDKAKEGIKEHIQDLESSAKWGEIGAESEARLRDVASAQTQKGVRGAATGGKFADVASETTEAYASFKGDQAAADVAEQDKYRMIKEERETTLTAERELAEDDYATYLQSVQDYDAQMATSEINLATSFKQTATTAVTGMMEQYNERDIDDTWFNELEELADDEYGGSMYDAIAAYLKDEIGVDTDWLNWEPGDLITTSTFDDGTYDYDFTKNVFNEEGRDPEGLDISGHDEAGFSGETGLHQETNTPYAPSDEGGRDIKGLDEAGFNEDNMFVNQEGELSIRDEEGYDVEGVDEAGWTKDEINAETGEAYDIAGNDFAGYNKDTGLHKDTGLNIEGYDEAGFKEMEGATSGQMWNEAGENKETGELTDSRGFTVGGVTESGEERNERGFNVAGDFGYYNDKYDDGGFDVDALHEDTGTPHDKEGYDINAMHKDTNTAYDLGGWDKNNMNENGTPYDDEGYRRSGYSQMGFNREGTNSSGQTYSERIDIINTQILDIKQEVEDTNNYVNNRYSGDWLNNSENDNLNVSGAEDILTKNWTDATDKNMRELYWAIGTDYGADKSTIGGLKDLYDKYFNHSDFGIKKAFQKTYGNLLHKFGQIHEENYEKFFKDFRIVIQKNDQGTSGGYFTMDQINAGNFFNAGSQQSGIGDYTNDQYINMKESSIPMYTAEKEKYGF